MNIASAVIAPPPASSRRCGATLAWARASSSVMNGALRLNWLPLSSRRACERSRRSSTPASCHHRSRVIVSGASQLCVRYRPLSPASDSNPATSQVTSTGVDPLTCAVDGTNPRGAAERSDDEPTTWIRTPIAASVDGTGPPPTSSIGQRSGRHGPKDPSRAGATPESHRPKGAIAAGRTTTPSRRTGFISTSSVTDPKPSPRISARAWSATLGLTGPCQVTRTSASRGDVLLSTERTAWSPATWDCAATPMTNAAASAMPSAGSNHRAGRRRPRAAASINGADQPLTLREQCAVSVERGLAAEVGEEHRGGGLDFAAADQVDQPGHGLALVDRVGDHPFGAGGQPHRVQGGVVGDAVGARVVALVQLDLLIAQLALQPDEPGGVTCDPRDLVAGFRWLGRGVDADDAARTAAGRGQRGEAGHHARLGAPGHRAHHDRVEEHAKFTFLVGDLTCPGS